MNQPVFSNQQIHLPSVDPQEDSGGELFTRERLEKAWSILCQAGYEQRTVVLPATLPSAPFVVGVVLCFDPQPANFVNRLHLTGFLATAEQEFIADPVEIAYAVSDRRSELAQANQQYLLLRLSTADMKTILAAVEKNEAYYEAEGLPVPANASDRFGRAVADELRSSWGQ